MDRYCPECNSTMTPSLVGYLCANCGHMQRFYSESATIQAKPEAISVNSVDTSDTPVNSSHPQKYSDESQANNKVRSTLKRLMVPELAPPHHEQLISNEPKQIPAQKADKLEPMVESDQLAYPSKAYQPDQIAQDFHQAQEPQTHHSNKWLWIALVLFLLSAIGLVALYLFYK